LHRLAALPPARRVRAARPHRGRLPMRFSKMQTPGANCVVPELENHETHERHENEQPKALRGDTAKFENGLTQGAKTQKKEKKLSLHADKRTTDDTDGTDKKVPRHESRVDPQRPDPALVIRVIRAIRGSKFVWLRRKAGLGISRFPDMS